MTLSRNSWQFWIDRGGTFTDIIARSPEGQLISKKLLSECPEKYQDAAVQGIRDILKLPESVSLAEQIAVVKMGTTVGTNALLERTGENTALLITQGLGDCLRIGYQNRPDIFALNIQLPEQLYSEVIEIEERVSAQGHVISPLNTQLATNKLIRLHQSGIKSIAIVLMHSWRYPDHELKLAAIAKHIGFRQISVSHQLSPFMKIVSRGDTTVVDAYLSPVLRRYINRLSSGLGSGSAPPKLLFMQSNGGLTHASGFQGKDCILSGPAGGVIGAVKTAEAAGFNKIIAFDMGGTSTDVAHYDGILERMEETELAGIRMRVPMLNIHTVAAGGGSILHFDGTRYRVGPDSAGADPGPAGYRRGGPLTVTDANIMLGKLPLFPSVFGPKGNLSLDSGLVSAKFQALAHQISKHTGKHRTPEQVAEGFITIAVENMATAIKKISVQKGYDVSNYTLCCYGAASGQHACQVAERLGMQTILFHPFSGLLSAYGMGLADFRLLKQQSVEEEWEQVPVNRLQAILKQLEQDGIREMQRQLTEKHRIESILSVFIRFHGTDTSLQVKLTDKAAMEKAFKEKYRQQFGFLYPDKALIIESVSAEIIAHTSPGTCAESSASHVLEPVMETTLFTGNNFHPTPVYQRKSLPTGSHISGPAIILETTSTIVIEPGWKVLISTQNNLIMTRIQTRPQSQQQETSPDPVLLEIFNKLFMSIAEQMGSVLQKTAHSVNIRERLDFSCAVFDNHGKLVANAPHIPVHLGSMGESVQDLLNSSAKDIRPGTVFLSNSPYHGGTHLPDITVISPVFAPDRNQLLFFVASRGHHADVGGISPGSMPSNSTHINQEGIVGNAIKIVIDFQFQTDSVRQWLTNARYPARNPDQNLADLQAQIAANNKGAIELIKLVDQYALNTVQYYMQQIQKNAEHAVRKVLSGLRGGHYIYRIDASRKIKVKVTVDSHRKTACIDFSGTSAQSDSNFNAPEAVCKAAVLYVFRTLVNDDIPLNTGCLKPLHIIIPEGSMLNPRYPAAVVAGNVETSQHIVDALYGALGILSPSQGTMNNLTFGNQDYQYYETICGGAGAGREFNGCDAVQTHMTNSRITDPEILEWRFPVILEQFSIRKNSGGKGKTSGGNGVIRKIRFLEPMSANILSSQRTHTQKGLQNGEAGLPGINRVIKKEGEMIKLPACTQITLEQDDILQIETPGGGGFGNSH